jgi:BMFP domain-containing protein YqiC
MRVKELHTEMHAEFKSVRTEMQTEFSNVRTEMQTEFRNVRAEMRTAFDDFRTELMAAMKAEAQTTRRHFDVVAEQFRDFTKVLADGIARNTERLDDHEKRITVVERSGC